MKSYYDFTDNDIANQISGNDLIDSDGNHMFKLDSNAALDSSTGEFHHIAEFPSDSSDDHLVYLEDPYDDDEGISEDIFDGILEDVINILNDEDDEDYEDEDDEDYEDEDDEDDLF